MVLQAGLEYPHFYTHQKQVKSQDLSPFKIVSQMMIFNFSLNVANCIRRTVTIVSCLLFFLSFPLFLQAEFLQVEDSAVQSGHNLMAAPRHFQLLNGLQVVAADLPGSPSIAIRLFIKRGTSTLQAPPGLVALLAAVWANPASNSPAAQFREGEIPFAIRTDPDSIVLQVECGPDALEFSLRLLGRLVMKSEVSAETLEQARLQLLSSCEKTSPLELGLEKFSTSLFGQHPYGRSKCGDPAQIKSITREQVLAFLSEQIKPNQAFLILSGEISNLEIDDMVRSNYGSWIKGGQDEPAPSLFVSRGDSVSLSLEVKGMPDALLFFGVGMPQRLSNQDSELVLLNCLLGGLGPNSRLMKEFSRRRIPFTHIESRMDLYRAGGQLQIIARLSRDADERAWDAAKACLDSFKNALVSQEELEMAQNQLIKDFDINMRAPNQLADWLGQTELYGIAPNFLLTYSSSLRVVTPERLRETAKQYFSSARIVSVVVRGTAH
jgi:zinc protease